MLKQEHNGIYEAHNKYSTAHTQKCTKKHMHMHTHIHSPAHAHIHIHLHTYVYWNRRHNIFEEKNLLWIKDNNQVLKQVKLTCRLILIESLNYIMLENVNDVCQR